MKLLRILLFISILHGISPKLSAQFYNGHQMTFGKNRVQYNPFTWQYFRFDRFDTYFYGDGYELAQLTSEYAFGRIADIESFFEYSLEKRIIFITYNRLTDFRQSNIGLVTGSDLHNTGGVNQIVENKVFLYYDGDLQSYKSQIDAAIAKVVFNEMLYGSSIRERLTGQTLSGIPQWFSEGLISYVSGAWNVDIENKVKDGILTGKYEKFNRLTGADATYAGHSIWRFIAENYGEEVIPNIIYLTKINRNSSNVFLYVLGLSLTELGTSWENYYREKYTADIQNRQIPDTKPIIKRPKVETVYDELNISPGGKYIAYTTNQQGKYKVWLYNNETGKRKQLLSREHRLDQIPDYSFPQLAWNPNGEVLAMFYEDQGLLWLGFYSLEDKKMQLRNMLFFEKILDFAYAAGGMRMVVSGVKKGQSDIYLYNIASNSHTRITSDLADDVNARFIDNSNKIIFSSNRVSDTISVEKLNRKPALHKNLFVYDLKLKSDVLTRITNTPYFSEWEPIETGNSTYTFLTDEAGIINRKTAVYDSTLAYVDTVMHYSYFTRDFPLTNYAKNIENQDIREKTVAEVLLNKGKYYIYTHDLPDLTNISVSSPKTDYGNLRQKKLIEKEQAELAEIEKQKALLIRQKELAKIRQTEQANRPQFIDINNYVFEHEKPDFVLTGQTNPEDSLNLSDSNRKFKVPTQKMYFTAFYPNYIVNQIDFGFLNASYQKYVPGSPVYFNPGMNMLFKIGTNDLFEDYKLVAGARFAADFNGAEYLLSIETLKDRLDKMIIYHSSSFRTGDGYNEYYEKIKSHELQFIAKYPLSQVFALRGTLTGRFDNEIVLAINNTSLAASDTSMLWGGAKIEFIFDNTRDVALNIYEGARFKIFAEVNKQVNGNKTDFFVVGGDFRMYHKIHRNLIWANRFALSTSLGKSRLMYYLGSVDNATLLYHNDPKKTTMERFSNFDKSNLPSTYYNFVYQTVATNMRGFPQNVRNGTSFALINSEIRWPIIRYFANRPLNNDFLNNFQIVGFADIGSAWSGWSPYSEKNAYLNYIIDRGSVRLIVDRKLSPLVAGYGIGVRSRLLGYFVRLDYAHGIDSGTLLNGLFYLSLNLDF
ncbi:MAG TPA: hypothetical protein DCQ31_12315 [Bacteroidales bacterium]|nr:hypothetical protein [Bacteroidales bacterium]